MSLEFGKRFQRLRQERGLSQSLLARQAGIALRTLGYWEAGERLPRIPELEAALTALDADSGERLELLSLVNPPRGRQEIRAVLAQSHSVAGAAWTETGDLLRAMRMRRGLTQAQTAAQLGMTRQAILRWETGKSLPTGDNLARLCAVLQAYPAEQQTLATGHWPALALRPEMSLDASVEAVETFGRVINGSDPSLADLYALALKRHLRLQCERSEQAVSLLAQTEHLHSLWLNRQGRRAEAQANLNWVLQRMRAAPNPEPFWDGALNLASLFAVIQKQSGGGERLTRQWLPRLPDGYLKLARLCDMAFYAAQDNRTEIAWEYLADAERQMWMRNAESDKAEKYLEVTRIRLLMMQGDTDAQAWLLRTAPSAYVRQDRMLGWAITLLKFGERNAAHRTLVEMESQIAPESIPTRRKGYASLVKKFGLAE